MDSEPPQPDLHGPVRPSADVERFIEEHPTADWRARLNFMIDRAPQMQEGAPVWLLEGGAAVHILHPQRRTPDDIDVISSSPDIAKAFIGADGFDVKGIGEWFTKRGIEPSVTAKEILFQHFIERIVDGKSVYMLDPVALAVSSLLSHKGGKMRDKAFEDLRLLNPNPYEVRDLQQQLTRV